MTSYTLSLMVVVVDPRRLELVFLAGKPAGSTLSSLTLKIVVLEEIAPNLFESFDCDQLRWLIVSVEVLRFYCLTTDSCTSWKLRARNYDVCWKDWHSFSSVNIFNKIDIILLILANSPVLLATEFRSFPTLK